MSSEHKARSVETVIKCSAFSLDTTAAIKISAKLLATGMLKAIRRLQQVRCAVSRPTYGVVEADIFKMSQPLKSHNKSGYLSD